MVLHNPNNWHWVNKNCLQWTKDYFGARFPGTKAVDGSTEVAIDGVESVEGDVDVSQRKGKVISLFDINIVMTFAGKLEIDGEETAVKGKISVPEVAYDTSKDEFDFQISISDDKHAKQPVKTLIRNKLIPQLRDILARFGPDLLEENGKDIQHPDQTLASKPLADSKDTKELANDTIKPVVGSVAYNTVSLKLEPVFSASAAQLYTALLQPEVVSAWTRSKAEIAPKLGPFSLFGGNISGEITKLTPNQHIEMTWRLRDWKQGHHSVMSLDLDQGDTETKLKVDWKGIPVGQEEITQSNFENYYVQSIKVTLGFGSVL